MASSPTAIGRVELQETGSNLNVWGDENNEVIKRLTEMGVGFKTISLTGDYTPTTTNYDANESRWGCIEFTDGGLSSQPTVTLPAETRYWLVINSGSTYAVACKASGSAVAAVTVEASSWAWIYCDGTDMFVRDLSNMSGVLRLNELTAPDGDVDLNSQKITSLADPTSSQDAATKAYVDTEVASVVSDAGAAAAASASAAATSASNASTSESNAATSEANAATSEANAAASEAAAAASAATVTSKISGPASATDNALVQFDGTTGKLAKNGPSIGTSANNLVQLDGSGNLPAVDGSALTGIETGSLTLLNEKEISVAVAGVEWTSLATGSYNHFLVEIVEASLSATGYLRIQLSPDAGSTWRNTGYVGESVRGTTILSETTGLATTNVNSITASDVQSGRFIVLEMASATGKTQMRGFSSYTSAGNYRSTVAFYQYDTAEAHDSIRVITNTGNIDAGTFRLYGVN